MKRRRTVSRQPAKTRHRKATKPKHSTGSKTARRASSSVAKLQKQLERQASELQEARDERAAIAEVLRVISASPGDLELVFQAMLENATRICKAKFGTLYLCEDDGFRAVATHNAPPAYVQARAAVVHPHRDSSLWGAAKSKQVFQVADVTKLPGYVEGDPFLVTAVKHGGYRTVLSVPMLKEDELSGVICIYNQEVRPFTDKQIELVQNFAAQAVIAIENTRLLNELRQRTADLSESLEQQTATSEILASISGSMTDTKPVFDAIVRNLLRLFPTSYAVVQLIQDGMIHMAALNGEPGFERLVAHYPLPLDDRTVTGRAMLSKQIVQFAQLVDNPDAPAASAQFARNFAYNSMISAPMIREDKVIGAIATARREPREFDGKQVALIKSFADQAVIAIENARLFEAEQQRTRELSESLEQQTATSEVLSVISSSPGELVPVFQAMLTNAAKLCTASYGAMWLCEGGGFRMAAIHGALPAAYIDEFRLGTVYRPSPTVPLARVAATHQAVQVDDCRLIQSYIDRDPLAVAAVEIAGIRTVVTVPMLKEDELIGALAIYRTEVRPFTNKQIELVQNFAAQAVIAIENTRLLNELRESLQQQTATADVLKVISRSTFDLQTVLDTLVESSSRLCDAYDSIILLRNGDTLNLAAHYGPIPVDFRNWAITRGWVSGRAFLDREPVHTPDLAAAEEFPDGRNMALRLGFRTTLSVPLLREDVSIGVITIRRSEVKPFTEKQIDLVRTFADQAVIAIENVRLFDEVQARTRDLTESLQQQTATADVLKIISRSTFDLQIVLKTLTESAAKLCAADKGVIFERDGELYRFGANYGFSREAERYALEHPIRPDRGSIVGRVALGGMAIHLPDVLADPEYRATGYQKVFGYRTNLGVPLLREGTAIGVFSLTRDEVKPFTEKQIELATTFADQAAIAIENARLLNELRQRTADLTESLEQQMATSEVLRVISSSPGDLEPVFQAMLENATRICEARFATLWLAETEGLRAVAVHNAPPAFAEARRQSLVPPGQNTAVSRVITSKAVEQVEDLAADPAYRQRDPLRVALVELVGARTLLVVPMLKEDELVGAISIYRQEVRSFTDKQIELLKNFAAQAVIAIENARLLNELRQRTTDLSKSLEDLRTAQDRLVQTQKLASLGQLTAGIAHEIKNPLNFVNNFSGLSVELLDELQEAVESGTFDDKRRSEIAELTDTLRGNLDKIAQHGKRADSIVKNMLLHSREGSGERRPVNVNALVEESLNLAYHGARAEKQGFTMTLERSFDPGAGEVDVFPQEITRVLLNLISNGFYAAAKRQGEADNNGYEPILMASTRNLGDRVEIRIRDNGTGIPPEVKVKMFNPFFTTKPAGEGTGLGLSISHDIIVKQHSGSIEVNTEPGMFTEFRIILPRTVG